MMTDVFISYSSANADIANELRSNLEKAGIVCWIAPRDIPPGSEYGAEIIKGIENTGVFLLCLTKESNVSQHVAREVERAVNKNIPILTYQCEKVELSKTLEYFLASTQWFTPDSTHDFETLANDIHMLNRSTCKPVTKEKDVHKNRFNRMWILLIALLMICSGVGAYFLSKNSADSRVISEASTDSIKAGDTFSYGTLEYGGNKEVLSWIVLETDVENNTATCIAQNIVAFQPYDAAESGTRGQDGETYYNEDSCDDYTDQELQQFWGNAEWATSNIRTWLNSSAASVTYADMAPIEEGTTIYENDYSTKPGFLYFFSDEERTKLVSHDTSYLDTSGNTMNAKDYVFLLSKKEVEKYLVDQNMLLSTIPTTGAATEEGSGVYASYANDGDLRTSWALRDFGDIPACTVLCAGDGMGHTEQFRSEYACDSLLGIRPAIVLPLTYVAELKADMD